MGVQIETAAAVENVRAILDVPGVDLCFLGPNDLHLALGCAPRFWSEEPAFTRAVARVKAACAERGMPLGTLCKEAASAQQRLDEGFTFLGLGSDAHFMLSHGGAEAGALRRMPAPESWCDRVALDGPPPPPPRRS